MKWEGAGAHRLVPKALRKLWERECGTRRAGDCPLVIFVDVPKADVRRRLECRRRHWLEDDLPLADEWGAWDIQTPPAMRSSAGQTHTLEQLHSMLDSHKLQETSPGGLSEMAKIVLEAGRGATEKMLDDYRRMGIEVTPEMTLAPEQPKGVQPAAR